MSFIKQLENLHVQKANIRSLKDMLVGSYNGYLEHKKEETLEVIIKLSYLLGKEMGKEVVYKNEKLLCEYELKKRDERRKGAK